MNELDVLKLVTGRLNKAVIDYMVSGSVALSFYTEPRMTRDIDIVIDIKKENITQMMEWCKHLKLEEILKRVLNERYK